MITDPIADMLTRIRNACRAGLPYVELPASKLLVKIANLLMTEGFIQSYELREDKNKRFKTLRIKLKYDSSGESVIRFLKRVSKPGLRVYAGATKLPRVLGGAGIAIISTSQGIMTDREARRKGTGGEVLCYVY
jgi:small subunit ribosomal protein S8